MRKRGKEKKDVPRGVHDEYAEDSFRVVVGKRLCK